MKNICSYSHCISLYDCKASNIYSTDMAYNMNKMVILLESWVRTMA